MILTFGAILFVIILLVLSASFKIGWGFYMRSLCRIKTSSKEVVLTFDDGPHPLYTLELLDLLKEKGVKATFFVIGEQAEKYPEIVRRMTNEGHKLGIHSYFHKPSFTFFSKKAVIKDLSVSKTLLENITLSEISFFRPPYGVTNPNIAAAVKLLNLKSVGWKIRSFDTLQKPEAGTVSRIVRSLTPGAIILLHDRLPNCSSLVGKLLTALEKSEYKIVSL